jgi:hypothetical protein
MAPLTRLTDAVAETVFDETRLRGLRARSGGRVRTARAGRPQSADAYNGNEHLRLRALVSTRVALSSYTPTVSSKLIAQSSTQLGNSAFCQAVA